LLNHDFSACRPGRMDALHRGPISCAYLVCSTQVQEYQAEVRLVHDVRMLTLYHYREPLVQSGGDSLLFVLRCLLGRDGKTECAENLLAGSFGQCGLASGLRARQQLEGVLYV